MCDLKGSSTITRSASVSSVFLSIMDLFRQALLCQVRCLPKFSPSVRFPSPCSRPPSFLSTFSLLSRVTHSTGRHHTEQCTEGFNIYRVLVYGPHSASFARTLSPSPPPVGIFRLLLFAMLIMLTLDTILFCFIPVNTSRFRPLFVQRATAVTIDRAAFIRVTVSEPFSFIYNLCSRFCQILAYMYDRGNVARGRRSPADRQPGRKRDV